jgi:hypothetical protein
MFCFDGDCFLVVQGGQAMVEDERDHCGSQHAESNKENEIHFVSHALR